MNKSDPLIAVVDESQDQHLRYYTMTAVVMRQQIAQQTAQQMPITNKGKTSEYHCVHATPSEREQVDELLKKTQLNVVVTVKAEISSKSEHAQESARQSCLAQLLIELNKNHVKYVTLDSRDDINKPLAQRHMPHDRMLYNDRDQATINALRQQGLINEGNVFNIRWRNGKTKPLWIADHVSYRARQTIQHDDLGYVEYLGNKIVFLEPKIQATYENNRVEISESAKTGWSYHLARINVMTRAVNKTVDSSEQKQLAQINQFIERNSQIKSYEHYTKNQSDMGR